MKKLRNKKTGEIIDIYKAEITVHYDKGRKTIYFKHLEDLDDWEDYEEPKEYWYLENNGEVVKTTYEGNLYEEKMQEIGNYFETKEEGEKAAEKLKAWKLLKDECDIKFDGVIRDDKAMLKGVKISYDRHTVTFSRMKECMNALHLLFGGEE